MPGSTAAAAPECTRPAHATDQAAADHEQVRRAYDDPLKQPDSKPTAKSPARNQATTDAPDSSALVESLQRAAGNAAVGALLADQHSRVPAAQSGQSLAPSVRQPAERKLGADLGDVRVHSDAAAAEYAESLHAEAVTVDRDVFLTSGVDRDTSRGRTTLLHELVHAAQSSGSGGSPSQVVGRPPSAHAPAEVEAREIAARGFEGAMSRPHEQAASAVPHLKTDDDESVADQQSAPSVTAEELLNPPESTEDAGPQPGTSGAGEGVAYEITIMQPLRAVAQAVDEQDWEKASDILQTIGMKLLNYQNAYEKSDPMLYRTLLAARGWMGVFYQQLNRRLDRDTWSDAAMTSYFKSDVLDEFARIEDLLH